MTIDEAIKHAEDVADLCEYEASKYDMNDSYESSVAYQEGKCGKEHRQLAEWLKDYKRLLEQEPCEDCISRKALLDKIKEVCFSREQKWVNFRVSQGSNGQRDFLNNYIEQLPSVKPQESKWIHVSDRLPENNEDVLVYDNSDIFVAWFSGIDDWCSADNRFDEYTPIIAWMPLPTPYEPQERSE